MTDWDNLEGDELNVALAKVAGTEFGDEPTYCVMVGGETRWSVLPDYANSIDAQKRDLEPLLPDNRFWGVLPHGTVLNYNDGYVRMHRADGPESLARARCLGKALEARDG